MHTDHIIPASFPSYTSNNASFNATYFFHVRLPPSSPLPRHLFPFRRRWKTNPEYPAWKTTDQLIGRRVARCFEGSNRGREPGSAGLAKRLENLAMRQGWVVRKDITSGLDQMFVVRFPGVGTTIPMKMEVRERERERERDSHVGKNTTCCRRMPYGGGGAPFFFLRLPA